MMLKHLEALPNGYTVSVKKNPLHANGFLTAKESRKVMKDRFQQMMRLVGLTVVEIGFDRIISRRTLAKCGPCFLSKSQKSYTCCFFLFREVEFLRVTNTLGFKTSSNGLKEKPLDFDHAQVDQTLKQ